MPNLTIYKKLTSLFVLGCIATTPVVAAEKNFYKWVDKNGSTHYTTTPPPSTAKRLGKVETYDDQPSNRVPVQQQQEPEKVVQQQPPQANSESIESVKSDRDLPQ